MRTFLILVVVLLVVLGVGLWWLAGDANRFKPVIAERIESETGLHVDLRGDLAWRLWPPVQLVAHDVVLDWVAESADPLARVERLQLDADLWPLMSRTPRLVVTGLNLDGLRANLVQDGERVNWMPPDHEGPAPPPIPLPANGTARPAQERADAWMIEEFRISGGHVRYTSDGELTEIAIDRLRVTDIAPERPIPVTGALRIVSNGNEVLADVTGHARFDAAMERYDFDGIRVSGTLLPLDLTYELSFDAGIDLPGDSGRIESGTLRLVDADATFNAVISDLTEAMQIQGRFEMPVQRPARLLRALEAEEFDTIAASSELRMNESRLVLHDLRARVDDTNATGTVTVHFAEPFALPHHIDFDLQADRVEIPEREAEQVTLSAGAGVAGLIAAAASVSLDQADIPILPLDMLRSYGWAGTVEIGELSYDGATFSNTRVTTENRGGMINADVAVPGFFEGAAETTLEIDARNDQPVWRVHPVLRDVNSQALVQWLDQDLQWAALLLADGELTLTGNTERELRQTVSGSTKFDGGQGQLSIGELKQQAMAIAALAGNVERVQRWPDVLDYRRLTGDWKVDGMQHEVSLLLDNLQLNINGTYDPMTTAMDMRVALTVLDEPEYRSLDIHPRLIGLSLPVRCRGSLDSPSCRPDEGAVRTVIADALRDEATGAARERLDDAIERHIPDEYRGPAQDLLRGLRNPRQERQQPEQ
jgi:AsmA protein